MAEYYSTNYQSTNPAHNNNDNQHAYGNKYEGKDWLHFIAENYVRINRYFSIIFIVLDIIAILTIIFSVSSFYHDSYLEMLLEPHGIRYRGGLGALAIGGVFFPIIFTLIELFILFKVRQNAPYAQPKLALVAAILYRLFIFRQGSLIFVLCAVLALAAKYLAMKENEGKGLFIQLSALEEEIRTAVNKVRSFFNK